MASQLALLANRSQNRIQNPPAAVKNAALVPAVHIQSPGQNLDERGNKGENRSTVRRKDIEVYFHKLSVINLCH